MKLLEFLSQPRVILISFLAMILLGASMGMLQNAMGGLELLDMYTDVESTGQQLQKMTADVRKTHLAGTLTLDVAFPIASAAFLAGALFRFAPRGWAFWLSWLPMLGALLDLIENFTVVMALRGNLAILPLKSVLTTAKFGCVVTSMGLVAVCLAGRLVHAILVRRTQTPPPPAT